MPHPYSYDDDDCKKMMMMMMIEWLKRIKDVNKINIIGIVLMINQILWSHRELGNHPNIVKLIGISPMLEDEFYIVMEYCDGKDALSYLKKIAREDSRRKWLQTIVQLCIDVCEGMKYIHSKGYTHRDITASNILVRKGRAVLGDLGLSRKIRAHRPRFPSRRIPSSSYGSINSSSPSPIPMDTEDDVSIFTSFTSEESGFLPQNHSLYAPPELKHPNAQYTKGCDVYCFGIALWEMLSLRRWSRDDALRGMQQNLAALNSFPPEFTSIISKCWHEEDKFRPTFDELLDEFLLLNHRAWPSSYRTITSPQPLLDPSDPTKP